jgi:hypothetical protein
VIVGTCSATALVLVMIFQTRLSQFPIQVMSLLGAMLAAAILGGMQAGFARMKWSMRWLPAALIIFMAAGWAIGSVVDPGRMNALLSEIDRLRPDSSSYMVMEAMPLTTFASAPWARVSPFLVLGTGLPLGAIGLVILIVLVVRTRRPQLILVLVWTLVVLIATLLKNRFGYYLVPMLAMLGGWVASWMLDRARTTGVARDFVAAAIGALAFAPNLVPARAAMKADAGVPAEWVDTLAYLRHNTPEPFGDPRFYDARYTVDTQSRLPEYSIAAWWDYGYWITRGARRVPIANPTQVGAAWVGSILSDTDPQRAAEQLQIAKARYVVLDGQLPLRIVAPPVYVMGKFETVIMWGGRKTTDFYEAMVVRGDDGGLLPAIVFYPAYYQTLLNRLYVFHGQQVVPTSSSVMTYEDKVAPNGKSFREITGMQTFPTYEQAARYLAGLGPGNHRLVGLQPDQSPVPLEPLPDYRLAWASSQPGPFPGSPEIVVFERRQAAGGAQP